MKRGHKLHITYTIRRRDSKRQKANYTKVERILSGIAKRRSGTRDCQHTTNNRWKRDRGNNYHGRTGRGNT